MKQDRLVKFKHSLKTSVSEENLVKLIVCDIREQMSEEILKDHKYNVQMLVDICNCVEDNIKHKKNYKCKRVSKKDIVLKVFSDLYSDIDLDIIDNSIEAIFENELIHQSSWARSFFSFVIRHFWMN